MRKQVIIIVALLLVLILISPAAYAASTNTIDRAPLVMPNSTMNVGDTGDYPAPVLQIRDDRGDFRYDQPEIFRLHLSDAEWTFDNTDNLTDIRDVASWKQHDGFQNSDWEIAITRLTSTYIQIEVTLINSNVQFPQLRIPLLTRVSDSGVARVTINPLDSVVTGGTYTFATVAERPYTVVSVNNAPAIEGTGPHRAGTVIVDETVADVLVGTNTLSLSLSEGFHWHDDTRIVFYFSSITPLSGLESADGGYRLTSVAGRQATISFAVEEKQVRRGTIIIEPHITDTSLSPSRAVHLDIESLEGKAETHTDLLIATTTPANGWLPQSANAGESDQNPILLSTPDDLVKLSTYVNEGIGFENVYFRLTEDIVLNDAERFPVYDAGGGSGGGPVGDPIIVNPIIVDPLMEWVPIGNEEHPFRGNFDGNSKNIVGLYVTEERAHAGLFGYSTGSLANVNVTHSQINMTTHNTNTLVGAIVGKSTGSISNCSSSATIRVQSDGNGLTTYTGGIAGSAVSIENSVNHGSIRSRALYINSEAYAGGIAGTMTYYWYGYGSEKLTNSLNTGLVWVTGSPASNAYAGGIVASMYYNTEITGCENQGDIYATEARTAYAGGIAGISQGFVRDSINRGSVQAETRYGSSSTYAGGISGYATETTESCENTGAVTGSSSSSTVYTGGISGYAHGITQSCENTGAVTGTSSSSTVYTGGIVGYNYSEINGCSNKGVVVSSMSSQYETYAGGIAGGLLYNSINQSYNTGQVYSIGSGQYNSPVAGGIAGIMYDHGSAGSSIISESFNTGSIQAVTIASYNAAAAGGIAGRANGIIINTYNTGTVKAQNLSTAYWNEASSGGIGTGSWNQVVIKNSYNAGKVDAIAENRFIGGIIPNVIDDYSSVTVQGCYTLAAMAPDEQAINLTQEQFENPASFTEFDFNNRWTHSPAADYTYPTLRALAHDASTGVVFVTNLNADEMLCYQQGMELNLSVSIPGEIEYQWYHNGIRLDGETSSQYSITSVTDADKGAYYVVASDPNGQMNASHLAILFECNKEEEVWGEWPFQLPDQASNHHWTIHFSQHVDPASLPGQVYVTVAGQQTPLEGVLASIDPENPSLVIIAPPDGGWETGTYHLYLTDQVTSIGGTPLTQGIRAQFTIQ